MSSPPQVVYGSDAIVRQLSRLNLPYIALVPGSSFRGLHDSLVNFNGNHNPEIILCLHEEHSVAIAHGFAKVTERPMAAVVHDAVGLMHATVAVYNAHCDRMPVLILGGNGPLDATRRRPWIDWIHTAGDEGALIRPYVKFDDQPASVQAAVQSIITATAAAAQIPRGPTYVCLDVALQEDELAGPGAVQFPSTERYLHAAAIPPGPSQKDVERIHDALLEAEPGRRLFLFGRVNRSQTSWDQRIELAERFNTRVLTDLKVAAAFPNHHPLHAAPPDLFLSQQAIEVIRSVSVIISFDWVDLAGTLQAVFGGLGEPPSSVRVVHITLDYPAIHDGWTKSHFAQPPVDIPVAADVDKTVSALLAVITPQSTPFSSHAPSSTIRTPLLSGQDAGRIRISDLADALYSSIPPEEICLIRVPLSFKGADLRATHPLSYLGQDGGATTGSGPGNAVGAALGLRHHEQGSRRLVPVAVLGDGDFLMGASALWSAAHHAVPLLVVVANNESFHNDEEHQANIAQARGRPVENKGVGTEIKDPAPDLTAHAVSLGAAKVVDGRVERKEELGAALRRAARVVREEGRYKR
ncbi:Benzoylformate decarboxylase [Madurella mycetomatis]|uniref:Benzoylformate decarboxylase n=1 Tax=Madurella mycetomatis TaxID=100816 RepID=A0A175WGI7_9PEZI|nr:Benzoylformate decarboxylase [Madurella mycetomatis]